MSAHPSSVIAGELAAAIRAASAASEKMRELHPDLLSIVYRQQWFRLLVPLGRGGLELSLPEAVRLEEAISWADGSLGWTVTLCSGAGWFAGFLPGDAFSDLLGDERLCMAGSGAPSGEAVRTPDGYIINGHWERASGALHATVFTANCVIRDDDALVRGNDGVSLREGADRPLVRAFLFTAKEVILHRSWNTVGLIATGSHSFEVRDLRVMNDRCFEIDPDRATVDHPLYRYPFLPLAETTLAVNLSGMAIHFVDCCNQLFPERIAMKKLSQANEEEMMNTLGEVREELYRIREEFYAVLEESWACCVEGCAGGSGSVGGVGAVGEARATLTDLPSLTTIPPTILQRISQCSHALAVCARQSVDRLYPYCGLSAAYPDSEINRIWRDIHTASQHSLLVFAGPGSRE